MAITKPKSPTLALTRRLPTGPIGTMAIWFSQRATTNRFFFQPTPAPLMCVWTVKSSKPPHHWRKSLFSRRAGSARRETLGESCAP